MIRGKAIEESLRFYLENRIKINFSLSDIQEYALDYYYLRTVNLSHQTVKKFSISIKSLVRAGLVGFNKIITANSNLLNDNLIKVNGINKYPDFSMTNVLIDNKLLPNCFIELKIIENDKFINNTRYQKQALTYAIYGNRPVILIYLIVPKKKTKSNIFKCYPQFLKIFPKSL